MAAHDQSIPIVEFAHSEINQLDYKYSDLFRTSSRSEYNADWYYVWSKSSKKLIERWHPSGKIIVGVTPSFLINTKTAVDNSNLPIVLVTLQYGLNHEFPGFVRPELLKFAIESKDFVDWVFMPHPNHRYFNNLSLIKRSLLSSGLSPDVVCLDNSPHLPSYLKNASIHITELSGSAIESLRLNKDTYVLNEDFYNEIFANDLSYSDSLFLGLPDISVIKSLQKPHASHALMSDPGLTELKSILLQYADFQFSF